MRQNEEDKEIFEKYLDLHERCNLPVPYDEDPTNPELNGGVVFEFFNPSVNPVEDSNDFNDYILAVLVYYNGYKFLLMGDNTKDNISEIMSNSFWNKIEDVDILLAPHHGRDSSYNNDFINHVNPYLTIISDKKGVENSARINTGTFKRYVCKVRLK